MGTERITFSFPGLLTIGQVSQQKSADYLRTMTVVRLATLGTSPSGGSLKVKLQLGGVTQATEYVLAAGLIYAENSAANVAIASGVLANFIVSDVSTAYDLEVEAEFQVAVNVLGGSTTDLGLGTLGQLKRFLLNSGIVAETTYDEAISFLGRGVAAQFDNYANRTFKRGTSIVEDFRGDTDIILLSAYPVEQIVSIGLKGIGESAFTTQTNVIDTIAFDSGILSLVYQMGFGVGHSQIRVTYDGGYWYDTSDDDTGTLPAGATLLPADLQMAWLIQCQQVWMSRDALGVRHADQNTGDVGLLNTRLGILKLVPAVEETLKGYARLLI